MLGQRRRRWANIEPTHGQCTVFAGISRKHETLKQCCVNVGLMSTLTSHWFNASCFLGYFTLADTEHSFNDGLMLEQCRRRWTKIKPALLQCVSSAWLLYCYNRSTINLYTVLNDNFLLIKNYYFYIQISRVTIFVICLCNSLHRDTKS